MKTLLMLLLMSIPVFAQAPLQVGAGGSCEQGGCQFEVVDNGGHHISNVGLYFDGEIQSYPTKGQVRMSGTTQDVTFKWSAGGKATVEVKSGTFDLTFRGSSHVSGTYTPKAQ